MLNSRDISAYRPEPVPPGPAFFPDRENSPPAAAPSQRRVGTSYYLAIIGISIRPRSFSTPPPSAALLAFFSASFSPAEEPCKLASALLLKLNVCGTIDSELSIPWPRIDF